MTSSHLSPNRYAILARLAPLFPVALAIAVHWRALFTFFSADDLMHLQQAYGLLPTPPQPWRFLTQVVYFRIMAWFFGPWPFAFTATNLALHAANICLVYRLFIRHSTPPNQALLAVTLFGACPLLFMVIGHAVIINDIAALACALLMFEFIMPPRPPRMAIAVIAYAVALLCKESVLFFPLIAVIAQPGRLAFISRIRALAPLLLLTLFAIVAFFIARQFGAAPAGAAYELSIGLTPIHNLMTYTSWFFSLHRYLPDVVHSLDTHAWMIGLPALGALMIIGVYSKRYGSQIRLGLGWWVVGLLPVLLLRYSAYPHYMYAALPGLGLATAGAVSELVGRVRGFGAHGQATPAASTLAREPISSVAVVALGVAYALLAGSVVTRRLMATLSGIDLPLDPQLRSMVVAGRSVTSLASQGLRPHTRLAILTAWEGSRVFGTRTGREYSPVSASGTAYDLQRTVLDDGQALRVFFPQLDTVIYTPRWSRYLSEYTLATRSVDGSISVFGSGPTAHERLLAALGPSRPDNPLGSAYRDSLRHLYPDIKAFALTHQRP